MIAQQQDRAVKPSANGHNIYFIYIYHGHNIVGQQLPTLLDVTCYIHFHSLLHAVGSCCAKFETGPTFESTTPNISFVPWLLKGSATKLDTFAQLINPTLETLRCNDADDNENIKKTIGLMSKTTTSHVHHTFLYISFQCLHNYHMKMPNFTFYRGGKQATMKFYFSFWAWIWSLEIQLQEGSPTIDKVCG